MTALFLSCRQLPSHNVFTWPVSFGALFLPLLIHPLILHMWAPPSWPNLTLKNFQRVHLKISSYWELEFQHMNFGRTNIFSPLVVCKVPVTHTQKSRKANYSRLVGRSLNKQENLHTRLVLGGWKMSRSLHKHSRILRLYIEIFTGFAHVHHLNGLSDTLLSQGCVIENGFHYGNYGSKVYSKDRED